jgi:MFS transporter, PPP family, 3-phenylpropionic acid transporter
MVPFLPIYLKHEQGLQGGQIGLVLGVAGFSILLTPVLMTFLADSRFDPRRLVSLVFGISGTSLLLLFFLQGFWWVLLLLCLHSLAYAAVMPLHDGMTFSLQRRMERVGQPAMAYNHVRVWGSIGFILPSLILFALLSFGWSTRAILLTGVGFSLLSLLNAFRLPDPRAARGRPPLAKEKEKLPTAMAAQVLLGREMRVFCLALFLTFIAAAAFGSFYPLYMVEVVGVNERWVGLIFNFGVVIEIFFMLGFGWLQARLGLRNIIIIGIACFSLQTVLLGLFPSIGMALLVQGLHGMIIVAVFMAPIMYINRHAGDHFRNSIQGLYTMGVVGIPRIGGIILAGQLAEINLRLIPFFAAGLSAAAALLLFVAFREQQEPDRAAKPVPDASG